MAAGSGTSSIPGRLAGHEDAYDGLVRLLLLEIVLLSFVTKQQCSSQLSRVHVTRAA
jgi:hypothetical protein